MSPSLIKDVQEEFLNRFSIDPLLVFSPGRINIIGEHTDYNDGFVFPDTTPKKARPLDAEPPQPRPQPQPAQASQPVTVIPAGYSSLTQSMHSYHGGGMVIREQHMPASYTSSLLGNSQVLGQQHGYGPVLTSSFNGQPHSSLSNSMG